MSTIPDLAQETLKEIRAAGRLRQSATSTTSIDLGRLQWGEMLATVMEWWKNEERWIVTLGSLIDREMAREAARQSGSPRSEETLVEKLETL